MMRRPRIGSRELNDAPTTPLRIIVGIVLAAAFVVVHLVLIVIDAAVSLEVSIMLGAFILVQEGVDVAQWGFKRATDIDYVRAKSGTPDTIVTSEHATVTADRAVVANGMPPSTGELRASERGDE